MTPSSFAKSVGFAKRQVRYLKPSGEPVGGEGGRAGQCLKAALVFRQKTRCSGDLGWPQEQTSLASVCLNFVWYQQKSPCDERIASKRCRVARGRLSSGGNFTWYSRPHFLYHLESLVLQLVHQERCASLRRVRNVDRIPLIVGSEAGPASHSSFLAPRSASLSAASFPSIRVCPGAHRTLTSWVCIASWQLWKAHCDELGASPRRPQITDVLSMQSHRRR